MPLAEAQTYFNADGIVQSIELFLKDPDKVEEVRPKIEEAAGRQIFSERLAAAQSNLLFCLAGGKECHVHDLTLIVLVAALNIISGLIMLVKDKGVISPFCEPGRECGCSHAHILYDRSCYRHSGHNCRCRSWCGCVPEYRIDTAVISPGYRHCVV